MALFTVCKDIRHEGIVLPTRLFNFWILCKQLGLLFFFWILIKPGIGTWLTRDQDVPHWKCTSSPGMGIWLIRNVHSLYRVRRPADNPIHFKQTWKMHKKGIIPELIENSCKWSYSNSCSNTDTNAVSSNILQRRCWMKLYTGAADRNAGEIVPRFGKTVISEESKKKNNTDVLMFSFFLTGSPHVCIATSFCIQSNYEQDLIFFSVHIKLLSRLSQRTTILSQQLYLSSFK